MRLQLVSCCLFVVSCATALAQIQTPAPSGIIIGQVIDAATGRPVPEAIVQLRRTGRDAPSAGSVIADVEGRYFFAGLPAGTYAVHASKAGYAAGAYGVRRPPAMTRSLTGAVELTLINGTHVLDAQILLWKHASISGIVTDERGDPMPGILVRPLQRTIASGRARFVGTGGSIDMTDDRGMYRLSRLPPGHYVISVMATQATLPAAVLNDFSDKVGAAAKANVFAVSPEISRPGSSGSQQFGDHVLITFGGLPIPLVSAGSDRLSVYQTTYAPGVWSIGEATVVSLSAGEDRVGVSIPMRPVPSARVSGRLIAPSGPLGLRALRLIPARTGDLVPESPFSAATVMTDAAGEFTFLGVPPGAHTLRVDAGPETGGAQFSWRDVLWASQTVVVGGADVSDLVVTLRPAVPVNGRVILAAAPGTQAATSAAPALDVNVSFPQDLGPVAAAGTRANTKGEFSTGLPGGSYYVTPQLPAGWFVKSIVVNDRVLGDSPFDVAGDSLNITITATNAPSRLTVTVRDVDDAAPGSVRVFLFPADRSAWTGYGPATRRIQDLRGASSLTGGSVFAGMPAGDYLVAAARDEFTADWPDPRLLDVLSRFAIRVTVADGQQQSLDIRTAQIR